MENKRKLSTMFNRIVELSYKSLIVYPNNWYLYLVITIIVVSYTFVVPACI